MTWSNFEVELMQQMRGKTFITADFIFNILHDLGRNNLETKPILLKFEKAKLISQISFLKEGLLMQGFKVDNDAITYELNRMGLI